MDSSAPLDNPKQSHNDVWLTSNSSTDLSPYLYKSSLNYYNSIIIISKYIELLKFIHPDHLSNHLPLRMEFNPLWIDQKKTKQKKFTFNGKVYVNNLFGDALISVRVDQEAWSFTSDLKTLRGVY